MSDDSTNDAPFIRAGHISYSHGDTPAIEDVCFSLEKGKFLAIVGPSGCGKTTLLHLIAGVLQLKSGELTHRAGRIAYVSQESALIESKTVKNNILLPWILRGERITPELIDETNRTLADVGLEGCDRAYPDQLSGGMKKRVELAQALVSKPDLLLMDEPFSALDAISREKLNVLCAQLNAKRGITVVLVTHGLREACYLADRIILLSASPARVIKNMDLPNEPMSVRYTESPSRLGAERELRKNLENAFNRENRPVQSGRRRGDKFTALKRSALAPIGFVIFLLVVTLVKRAANVPSFLLPYPHDVIVQFFSSLASGAILKHLFYTMFESAAGFAIALVLAVPAGYATSANKTTERLLSPLFTAINAVPIVAFAPFLTLWLGLGIGPRLVSVILICFFPLTVSAFRGFSLSQAATLFPIKLYKPTKWRAFIRLRLPAAAPVVFSGIRVAAPYAVIGAVVGEFVSGADGLGGVLTVAKVNFDVSMMFVALTWLALLGVSYSALAALAERIIIKNR